MKIGETRRYLSDEDERRSRELGASAKRWSRVYVWLLWIGAVVLALLVYSFLAYREWVIWAR